MRFHLIFFICWIGFSWSLHAEENCGALTKKLSILEGALTKEARKEWNISKEWEDKIDEIFWNPKLSQQEKEKLFWNHLIAARLDQFGPIARRFIEATLKDAVENKSIYSATMGRILSRLAGPHYNPVFNRVGFKRPKITDFRHMLVFFHELEHSAHRNSQPFFNLWMLLRAKELFMFVPTPATPLARFHMESRAVGAQWEAVKRIPLEVRLKLIQELHSDYPKLEPYDEFLKFIALTKGLSDKQKKAIKKEISQAIQSHLDQTIKLWPEINEILKKQDIDPILAKAIIGDLFQKTIMIGKLQEGMSMPNLEEYTALLAKQISTLRYDGFDPEQFRKDFEQSGLLEKSFDNVVHLQKRFGDIAAKLGLSPESQLDYFRRINNGLDDETWLAAPPMIRFKEHSFGDKVENLFEGVARNITITSLENAHLSKQQFIEKVMPVHGYALTNLLKSHYDYKGWWKIQLALMSIPTIALTFVAGISGENEEGEEKNAAPFQEVHTMAKDLEFYWNVLAAHLNEEASKNQNRN